MAIGPKKQANMEAQFANMVGKAGKYGGTVSQLCPHIRQTSSPIPVMEDQLIPYQLIS